jgi:hypothetical protein
MWGLHPSRADAFSRRGSEKQRALMDAGEQDLFREEGLVLLRELAELCLSCPNSISHACISRRSPNLRGCSRAACREETRGFDCRLNAAAILPAFEAMRVFVDGPMPFNDGKGWIRCCGRSDARKRQRRSAGQGGLGGAARVSRESFASVLWIRFAICVPPPFLSSGGFVVMKRPRISGGPALGRGCEGQRQGLREPA